MTGIVIPATAAAAVFVVVAVVGLVGAVFSGPGASFSGPGASPRQITASHPGISPPARNEAVVRNQAVTWIVHQVSRAAVVACDAQVCADLASRGFPGASLLTIGPQSNNPLGANLVVSTAAVRAQFPDRLASVYAPAVIAAFGSGNARIEIRLEYPGGATAYNDVQQSYARDRKATDALLLTNNRFTFSAGVVAAVAVPAVRMIRSTAAQEADHLRADRNLAAITANRLMAITPAAIPAVARRGHCPPAAERAAVAIADPPRFTIL
jgi:hypothetical protein